VANLDSAHTWADAITLDMQRTGYEPAKVVERRHMCAVTLDLDHPDTDLKHVIVVSSGGWVVGYDGSVDAWTVH
jgi:hypothetical protein